MKEQEIVDLLLARDEAGMDALLRHYGPLLRYVIAPILPNTQDQEDCLSEISMRVWERIALYDPARGNWTAWLTALGRNAALNFRRGQNPAFQAEEIPENAPSPGPTPEEEVLVRERRAAVARAVKRLSPKEQTLFYRKYYYQQPVAQIASELSLTERAVEGKLYRIRIKLRKTLGGEGYGKQ